MNSLNGLSYTSTNLSGLVTGNFDKIVSNDLTSLTTYQGQIPIQNIIFLNNLTSNIQQQIDSINSNGNSGAITDLQIILTGASWDVAYNFLNLSYNLHVYGTLTVGNPQIDVGNTLLTLPSTYATISDLQTNYVTFPILTTEINNSLVNYVLYSGLTAQSANYETKANLQLNYVTYDAQTSEFNNRLANYVLNSGLTTTLNSYVLTSSLTTTLNSYVLTSSLTTKLNDYVLTSSLTTN